MKTYDIIVYGASSSGVAASIAAARHGKRVLLISENEHVGGMTTSGLSASDLNSPEHVGGIVREFYQNVYRYYENPEGWKYESREQYFSRIGKSVYSGKDDGLAMQWVFEPKVVYNIFCRMLVNEGVEVVFNHPLMSASQVGLEKGRINKLQFP